MSGLAASHRFTGVGVKGDATVAVMAAPPLRFPEVDPPDQLVLLKPEPESESGNNPHVHQVTFFCWLG